MMMPAAQSLTPSSFVQSPLLSIQIDAMDTAKYRVPRNLAASKEFACLWRPELHLVGTITEGLSEVYWMTDQDVAKDSNLQVTVIAAALSATAAELGSKGVAMPPDLRIHSDNSSAEGKPDYV